MRPDIVDIFHAPYQGSREAGDHVSRGRDVHHEMLPDKEGMAAGRRRGWNRRDVRRHAYSVVRRMLESNAGRPWSQVWSEICQMADARSGTGLSFREAVMWKVDNFHGLDATGRPTVDPEGEGARYASDMHSYCSGAYVDRNGILRYVRRRRYHRDGSEYPVEVIKLDDYRELRLIAGNWFHVTYGAWKAEPSGRVLSGVDTRVCGGEYRGRNVPRTPSTYSSVVSKRSLGADELVHHGLRNFADV